MLDLILLAAFFWQGPARDMDVARLAMDGDIKAHQEYRARLAAAQKAYFEDNFEDLVKAMQAFSTEYNRYRGQVWPAKEAENLRKAMSRLQSADRRLSARH